MTENPDPYSVNPPTAPPPPPNFPPPRGTPSGEDTTPAAEGAYMGPPPSKDDQNMAMLCYILGIFFVGGLIGPLIIWMTRKETSPFVNDQGREVLNWELTIIIGYVACMFTFCIPFVNILGIIAIFGMGITNLVFCILGAMSVNNGTAYRMPFSIKFLK